MSKSRSIKKSSNTETVQETENPDFERAMDTLESLVAKLETGNLTLEQSLNEFEKGVQLSRFCQKALSDAEQRIKILIDDVEQDFKPDSE